MIKKQIKQLMIDFMKAKESNKLSAIKMIMAKIKEEEINNRSTRENDNQELSDDEILLILQKMVKQREDSISQFLSAKREDLADKEKQEIEVIKSLMPKAFTEEELEEVINKSIKEVEAKSMKDMKEVINYIKNNYPGRVENIALVSKKLKEIL